MPLPLPNLDTRRWADLVDEGRALLPRFSPGWTDHNIHDPGITLIELLAFLTEEQLYRVNRIPDRHRRKFLVLLGYPPRPPLPASVILGGVLPLAATTIVVPAGTVLLADASAGVRLPFLTLGDVSIVEAQLTVVQVFDGKRHQDRTRSVRELLPLPLFGADPSVTDPGSLGIERSFYLGFDRALPKNVAVSLHFHFAGSRDDERQRILDEAAEVAAECVRPPGPCAPKCPPSSDEWCSEGEAKSPPSSGIPLSSQALTLPAHHSVRTEWDYLAADGWHHLQRSNGEIDDETRGLTLDGFVTVRIPGDMSAASVGAVAAPQFYLRCRLVRGSYDSAPLLLALTMNAVAAEQALPVIERFVIAGGVVPAGAIVAGQRSRFALGIDTTGVILAIEAGVTDAKAPELLVVAYDAPTASAQGAISLSVARLPSGTGLPEQHPVLPDAPVSRGILSIWTLEPRSGATQRWIAWDQRLDLDAAKPNDARFSLAPTTGEIKFGDGLRGRVPPDGAPMLAAYQSTAGAGGKIAATRSWSLADIELNRTLLGADYSMLAATTFRNASPSVSGADEEDIGSAAARAAASLWAHERLVRLCPSGECGTLDQLDREQVLDLPEPERATTLLDFERIALGIPGTRVRRARAWAELDPAYPGLRASGTVTVVVVPELPRGKPVPSAGLLRVVRRWLDRRRVLCTRLVVAGPEYLTVSVTATVHVKSGSDSARVQSEVIDALTGFLDPLRGGPAGRGWPFGRDVYRSEVMQVVDGVRGVDHVVDLTISADGREVACGNICIPPTWLVASGTHLVEVTTR